jgi:hypothetical protein
VKVHPVTRLQPCVQAVLFQVFDQAAASAVHDALGSPGGPRGEQDEQRVVEAEIAPDPARGVAARGQFLQREL